MPIRPRFRRNPYPIRITDRDLELIRHVHRHRFLTSQHLKRLVKGGRQGIERRLKGLYHSGYLDRPRCQLDYYHLGGSKPLVYGLGNKGAELLTERNGRKPRTVDWTARNRSATRFFLKHTLDVADFATALEASVRESVIVRHTGAEELAASLGRDSRADLRWSVSFTHASEHVELGVIPDQIFALTRDSTVHYVLEVDRATMPVSRRGLTQTSVQRKLLAYHATWNQRLLEREFGWKRFRVLFLTSSKERVEHLRQAARELPGGRGLFLFAHRRQLTEDVLNLGWLPVTGDEPIYLGK